ncbi:hypothetical protein GOP47_0005488 [Adiantum capillus-veneris]|uniref:Sec20 C-terminal domain-containing protein n=1 Tax=Adiantum capillus-veneris TaxID=13818 RepID=A0A9D4V580_ADICA|nr:hypothetical protein GOP47_0005488 [Adiantum capillus-veneris]
MLLEELDLPPVPYLFLEKLFPILFRSWVTMKRSCAKQRLIFKSDGRRRMKLQEAMLRPSENVVWRKRRFDLLAHQSLSVEEKIACLKLLETWKTEYQILHAALREANLQAKSNIQKAAKSERELLLGGGEESTNLRRNLQTQAGMSAAAESVTEALRRTRQMMVQELERGHGTLVTLDGSSTTLRKADAEYHGQRSLLNTTRNLLSVLKRQDVIDRIILVVGFLLFAAVVVYIFNQRIGLFKMQRTKHTFYGGHSSRTGAPSISIDVPLEGGMDMSLQDPSSIRSKDGSTHVCSELEACMPPEIHPIGEPSNAVPIGHTEL